MHIICMLDQLRVDKIPEEYILKRYTRNARQNATFDRRDYEQTAPDGSSMFCRRRLLAETAMDLANRGVKSDRGYNRALAGMRKLIQEVNVINEEEEAEKIMDVRGEEQGKEREHAADGAFHNMDDTILPPPVSNTKGRKKESKSANKKAATNEKSPKKIAGLSQNWTTKEDHWG